MIFRKEEPNGQLYTSEMILRGGATKDYFGKMLYKHRKSCFPPKKKSNLKISICFFQTVGLQLPDSWLKMTHNLSMKIKGMYVLTRYVTSCYVTWCLMTSVCRQADRQMIWLYLSNCMITMKESPFRCAAHSMWGITDGQLNSGIWRIL